VAFARPGKPRRNRFCRQNEDAPGDAVTPDIYGIATVFKAPAGYGGTLDIFRRKQEMAAAKKREARKSVHQRGWITLEGGFAARQCVVHDLSSAGAKITIEDASVLAGGLRLAFSRDARSGRNCKVVWRRGKSFGVKFVK
jgi:hypothetical protein